MIAALYSVQKQMGRQTQSAWIPRVAMDTVATKLGMAPIRVYEVATFYLMFNTSPIGRYHFAGVHHHAVLAARQLTWWRRRAAGDGDQGLARNECRRAVHHEPGFECLGACVNAPILQVDDDYYEDMDGPAVEALLAALARGERPKPGSVIGGRPPRPRAAEHIADGYGVGPMLDDKDASSPTSTGSTTGGSRVRASVATGTAPPRSSPAAGMRSSMR